MRRPKSPEDPFRIAMVGSRGTPVEPGGSGTPVEELGRHLADRGHPVVVHGHGKGGPQRRRVKLPMLRTGKLEAPSRTGLPAARRAQVLPSAGFEQAARLGLEPNGYHLLVARSGPGNHVDLIIEGYVRSGSRLPLLVVGSHPTGGSLDKIRAVPPGTVRFLGNVQDRELLEQLYGNARIYWHGHSGGGADASLLRAMGAGTAVNAFDAGSNRAVLRGSGHYFTDPQDVAALVRLADAAPGAARNRGRRARDSAAAFHPRRRPAPDSAGSVPRGGRG